MGDLQFNGPPLDQGGDLKGILKRQGQVPLASLRSFQFFSFIFISPECIARVPVSLWGCGGRAVFARRCATVRNRPREDHMAVPMVSSAKGVTFRVFQLRVASFRVAGVALCDIPTCFMTCQKLFCVTGAILLPHVQKMHCIFSGRRNTLETSHVILRGRRSTFDVSCCGFFANRIVRAVRSGDKVQILWRAWHLVTHHENRRKPRTKRRFWGGFVRKLVGKRRFWSCKVWNVRKSRTKCSFWCPNMSRLESLASLVLSQCHGGSCKTHLLWRFQNRLSCCFA